VAQVAIDQVNKNVRVDLLSTRTRGPSDPAPRSKTVRVQILVNPAAGAYTVQFAQSTFVGNGFGVFKTIPITVADPL
jgi:hypothetical protein